MCRRQFSRAPTLLRNDRAVGVARGLRLLVLRAIIAAMPKLVVHGAMLQCTMGMAPGTLSVLPTNKVAGEEKPFGTVMDFAPMTNIAPFGMCQSPTNPQVAAATAAAMGVLTPQPCVPVIPAPWTPGSPIAQIGPFAMLTEDSQCMCTWAGTITITQPGATEFTAD